MPGSIEIMKQRVLEMAFRGELVEQRLEEGNAKDLLTQIKSEKEKLVKEKKIKKENNLPEIFKEELYYKIPQNWIWTRLGEIGDWGAGSTPKRSNLSFWDKGTIPWLKTGELNNSYINTSEEFITEEALQKTSVRINNPGDILIAMYGATIGKLGILEIGATTNQACCACTPFSGLYNMYLFYYLMASRQAFINSSEGGAQPNISRTKIIRHVIPLPPFSEQKRIVSKIEEIFKIIDKIAERREDALQTIQLIRETTLQQAIQGKLVEQDDQDEPAAELINRIEAEKAFLIKEKKIKKQSKLPKVIKDEIEFEVPKGWEWTRLATISNFSSHQSVKSTDLVGESVLTELEDIESNSGKILQMKTVNERLSKSNKYVVQEGNVLYGKLRPYLNKVAIADVDGYCSTEIFPIHFYGNIVSKYMMYVLRSPYFVSFADRNSQGTKMPRLGSEIGKRALIPVPPLAEQQRIVSIIDTVMEICDQMEELFK